MKMAFKEIVYQDVYGTFLKAYPKVHVGGFSSFQWQYAGVIEKWKEVFQYRNFRIRRLVIARKKQQFSAMFKFCMESLLVFKVYYAVQCAHVPKRGTGICVQKFY